MLVTKTYELKTTGGVKATIAITAPGITGAEQDLVILDEDNKPLAVVQMQPGTDRREIRTEIANRER